MLFFFIIAYTIPIESFDGISSVQFNEVISVIISTLLIAVEFIIWGIILGYEKEKSSKNDNKSCETIVTSIWQRIILFIIIIFISVIVLAFSFNNIGRIQSENMTQFKIVRDTYFDDNNTCHVVVYETKDAYILSDALIYDNNIYINKETQTIQDKNSLDMIIKNFNATKVLSNEEYDNKVKASKE